MMTSSMTPSPMLIQESSLDAILTPQSHPEENPVATEETFMKLLDEMNERVADKEKECQQEKQKSSTEDTSTHEGPALSSGTDCAASWSTDVLGMMNIGEENVSSGQGGPLFSMTLDNSNGDPNTNLESMVNEIFQSQSTATQIPPISLPSTSSHFISSEMDPKVMYRQLVDQVCADLLNRYRHAEQLIPKHYQASQFVHGNPILGSSHLLTDSLSRLRLFLFGLEPMTWLTLHDRNVLYSASVCTALIFRCSAFVDLSSLPVPFALPYGEHVSDVEALHLILSHDLFLELKVLIDVIQKHLGHFQLPVYLLVLVISFFTPQSIMYQSERVMKIHDFYTHKLQVYLTSRFGQSGGNELFARIMNIVEKAKNFSFRLRELMEDVSRSGMQKHHQTISANIGLSLFTLQTETGIKSATK